MRKFVILLGIITLFAVNAAADIPMPKKKDSAENRLPINIRVSNNAREATLNIPRSAVKTLRAQLDEADGDDNPTTAVASLNENSNFSRMQTVASGLFLSLAVVFAGVWLARGKNSGKGFSKSKKTVAAVCLLVLSSIAAGTAVFANAPPPPIQGINGDLFSNKMRNYWSGADGTVRVIIYDDKNSGGKIYLEVPRGDGDKTAE